MRRAILAGVVLLAAGCGGPAAGDRLMLPDGATVWNNEEEMLTHTRPTGPVVFEDVGGKCRAVRDGAVVRVLAVRPKSYRVDADGPGYIPTDTKAVRVRD